MTTPNIHPDALTAKVATVNRANELVLEWVPKVVEALTPFDGCPMILAGGGFPIKVKKAIEKLKLPDWGNNRQDRVFITTSGYNVELRVGVDMSHQGHGDYQSSQRTEVTVYLFDLVNGALGKRLGYMLQTYRTDFTVKEVFSHAR
jgi:hypothetical protein